MGVFYAGGKIIRIRRDLDVKKTVIRAACRSRLRPCRRVTAGWHNWLETVCAPEFCPGSPLFCPSSTTPRHRRPTRRKPPKCDRSGGGLPARSMRSRVVYHARDMSGRCTVQAQPGRQEGGPALSRHHMKKDRYPRGMPESAQTLSPRDFGLA